MNTSIVKSVQVVNQKRGEFDQMIVEFENGLEITRSLTKAGKYQFICGKLFSNCIPTVESVQNAINYVGADSDCMAAQPKKERGRPAGTTKPDSMKSVVRVRLSDAERAEVARCLHIAGESESEFIRGAIAMRCKKTR